jgi:putative transcriptional regulator
MSKFFDELMESVQEMDEILRGEKKPSREFHVDALQVKQIRKATGMTQAKSQP